MARGTRFREVRRRLKEAKEGGNFTRRLVLKDGETALVWFPGKADEEPYIGKRHYSQSFGYFACGEDTCVACAEAERGNTAYRRGSGVAAFNVIDTRFFHKIAGSGNQKAEFHVCTEDARCRFCKRKVERTRAGARIAEWSLTWAEALGAQEDKLSQKCASCKNGKIRVVEFECPACGDLLDWDGDEEEGERIKCGACGKKVVPDEVLECSQCSKPVRASIFEFGCPVEVTRSGDGTNTSYNFSLVWPPIKPDKELFNDEFKPHNLEEAMKPMSAEKMASKLGIRNPFNRDESKQFESYDADSSDPFVDNDDNPF